MKTMLHAFNLHVLDKILNQDTTSKPTASAQMLYINCLMKHFRGKPLSEINALAFDMFQHDFPNYTKWHKLLVELHQSSLIEITGNKIHFPNKWSKYFDKGVFSESFLNDSSVKTLEEMKASLLQNQSLIDLCGLKHKSSINETKKLMELFVQEQSALDTEYSDEGALKKHFLNWFPKNFEKLREQKIVRATKILGDEE